MKNNAIPPNRIGKPPVLSGIVIENHSLSAVILTVLCAALILHAFGLMVALKTLFDKRNNKIHPRKCMILIYVSLTDILCSAATILAESSFLAKAHPSVVLPITASVTFFSYPLAMLMITFNQLLSVVLHIRYATLMTKKRVALMFLVGWFVGASIGILEVYTLRLNEIAIERVDRLSSIYYRFTAHLVYLLTTVTMYVVMVTETRRTNRMSGASRSVGFRLVYLIVGSYVLFSAVPDFTLTTMLLKGVEGDLGIVGKSLRILYSFGLAVDGILYFIMEKGIRESLFEFICCCKAKQSSNAVASVNLKLDRIPGNKSDANRNIVCNK